LRQMSTRGAIVRNLAGLVFVGCLLRLVAAQGLAGGLGAAYQGDEVGYVTLAGHLVHDRSFTDYYGVPTSYRTPGLPLLLTLPIGLAGLNPVVGRIFMCLIGSLLIPACYLLGRASTGSEKIAWTAAALAAFFPTWVFLSSSLGSDIPAAILVTLMAWMLIEGRQRSVLWMVGAGILWGAATLVRPVVLVYAPGICLWLWMALPERKRRLAALLAVVIPYACLLAPWTVRNTRVNGTFVLVSTQGGSELYKSNNPEATGIVALDEAHFHEALEQRYPKERYPNEAVRSSLFQADGVDFIRHNPRRFAELCVIRLIQLWKVYSPRVPLLESVVVVASFGIALPFFLIQMVRRGWQRGPDMLVLFLVICHTAVHTVFTSAIRYRVPIEPLVIIAAVQGLSWVAGYLELGSFTLFQRRGRLPVETTGLSSRTG
jgi:4-amino-4-deoxy-L-arabinose transferase-like glycosyltransferase